jgi:tRNA-specific 2-thiouridylase
MNKKVIVAMSGGVDSSVTAYLMREKGYEVIGVTLDLFEGNEELLKDAENVANFLGIKWYKADYRKEFKEEIISYFISTYRKGRTPNPCSYCNKWGKLQYLFNEMQKNNASKIVSGHYARVIKQNETYFIAKGIDETKDQSYYLSLLESFEIANLEFPLGDKTKEEIRKIASTVKIPVAEKKDSQEVCFLKGENYQDFLKRKIKNSSKSKGYFILNGKKLKEHDGIEFYTIGQRKGLGIGHHVPLYVSNIDAETNNIILSEDKSQKHKGVKLSNCKFNTSKHMGRAKVKLRYRMKDIDCTFEIQPDNKVILLLDEPQFSIAPGQVATLYENDIIICGGFIESSF